jgi:hypothetical protein
MKINDHIRAGLKKALYRACLGYIRAYEAGESPYGAFRRLCTLTRRLDGHWKARRGERWKVRRASHNYHGQLQSVRARVMPEKFNLPPVEV